MNFSIIYSIIGLIFVANVVESREMGDTDLKSFDSKQGRFFVNLDHRTIIKSKVN